MIYITGDTHRDFRRLDNVNFSKNDMLIILGDMCVNYFLDDRDKEVKDRLNKFGIKIFAVRGNHEERLESISTYKETNLFGAKVFIENDYPNLLFAKDGEIYEIGGNKVLTIGGAYSIDKNYRIMYGYEWFPSEQLSEVEMKNIYDKVKNKHFDIILTHTCPKKYEPTEMFLDGINQSMIDKKMEIFLDKIEEDINYDKWYCGHYHTDKYVDKVRFMFKDIELLSKELKQDKKENKL